MSNEVTQSIHAKGGGRSAATKELLAQIRAFRRENALEYAQGQPERLRVLEDEVRGNEKMKDVEKFRMLIEIEKIRQTEITNALPSEQTIKVDDDKAENSRQLMAARLSKE